jgi:4-amino-4-deoxy-L-arabinose transferase-like glycosyltransferase
MSGRGAGILFWGAAGLAVLAKGPVGLLLPLGIALVTLAWDRDLDRWRDFAPFSGPLVFAAVIASWIVPSIVWGGEYSVLGALREHFVDRAIHGMHHEQPFWYYLKVLPYALFPWTFLLPGAFVLAWRRRRQPDDRFLLVATLFVVAFFTVSTEKRDLYVLPAVPIFALLFARLVGAVLGWWDAESGARGEVPGKLWVTWPQGVAGSLMALVGTALPFVAPRFGEALIGPAWGLAAVLVASGLVIVASAIRGRPLQAVTLSAGAMAALLLVAVSTVYPVINASKSGRELADVVRVETAATRAAGQAVLALDIAYVSRHVNFYGDGIYVRRVDDPSGLAAALTPAAETYALANEKLLPEFPDELRQRMEILYSTRLSRRDIVLLRFTAR